MYLHELLLLARPQLSLTWYKKWATEINNHIKLYVNEKWEIKWEKGRGEELSWSNNETLIMLLDIMPLSDGETLAASRQTSAWTAGTFFKMKFSLSVHHRTLKTQQW